MTSEIKTEKVETEKVETGKVETGKVELTAKEMLARIEELQSANANLIKTRKQTVKDQIATMIAEGINSIEEISETLKINAKNVSSNLTRIRADLKAQGQTIVTQRIEKKTMLAVVSFEDMKW